MATNFLQSTKTATIQIKHGNQDNLPRLKLGELAICFDTGILWVGTPTGNMPLACGCDFSPYLRKAFNAQLTLTAYGVVSNESRAWYCLRDDAAWYCIVEGVTGALDATFNATLSTTATGTVAAPPAFTGALNATFNATLSTTADGEAAGPPAFTGSLDATFNATLSTTTAGTVAGDPTNVGNLIFWGSAYHTDGVNNNDPVGSLTDQSASGWNMTSSSTARPLLKISSGKKYLNFDGSNDVLTDGTSWAPGTSSFSIGGWFRSTSTSTKTLVSKYNTTSDVGVTIQVSVNNFQRIFLYDGTNTRIVTYTTCANNTWYHIMGVCDRSGNLTLYVNGTSQGTPVAMSGLNSVTASTKNLMIGQLDGIQSFQGDVEAIVIYSRALTSTEVNNIMTWTQPF